MRVRLLLIPLIAAAALLAGCTSNSPSASATPTPTTNGYENKSADEIMQAATDALTAAKSFQVKISGSTGEEIDLTFAGEDVQGTISEQGGTGQLLKIGNDAYIKGDDAFWAQFIQDATKLAAVKLVIGSKWAKFPAAVTGTLLPSIADLMKPDGSFTKGDVITTTDGTKAITIKDSSSELHVSLVGKPYPLEGTSSDGSKATFSDFDKDVTITAPAASDVADLSAFIPSQG